MELQQLALTLRDAFPEAAIHAPLSVLGEGFGSVVVETANGVVFRIAKHADAQAGHRREKQVLPVVQRSGCRLRVPEVQHFVESSPSFPYGVIGYAKLPGRSLSPNDIHAGNRATLAGQVAEFLAALHNIDIDAMRGADLPEFPPTPTRLRDLWRNVSPYLERHLSGIEYQQIQRRRDELLAYRQRYPYAPTLVLGDSWYDNLLFDAEQQRLVGIIDFENVSIGDVAIDLATQHYLDEWFAQEVVRAYYGQRIPSDLHGRFNALLAMRDLMGLDQGIRTGEVDEDALEKVRQALLTAP